ncbi:hypothetical protein D9615_003779 [Tricholomella constricta]|uniref:DNA breaking-rejoining enzyme n=1 Tax=Tricholomella constricta TaxID=117010 RepID=A0A8H5M7Q8_9AGAR|nr:hypothetical protein D9615_003779 [Tricholomella constricta]
MSSETPNSAPLVAVDIGFGLFAMRRSLPRTPTVVNTSSHSQCPDVSHDFSPLESMASFPRTTSTTVAPGLYVIPTSARRIAAESFPTRSARPPSDKNYYQPSPYRPLVPADRRLLLWTTPHSQIAHDDINSQIPPDFQPLLYERFFDSLSNSTRQSYGAGLLRFTQFCDRLRIPESLRMPASDVLLSAFVADASGSHSGDCVRNWLNGLRCWHIFNRAEWHGRDPWVLPFRKAANKLGVPFKRPPRHPISTAHLLALYNHLDRNSPRGAAVWAAALAAFWGCRRLGELLPTSSSFSSSHVSRASNFKLSYVNDSKVLTFHLPSTKTSPSGEQCILTGTNNIFCPVTALQNHLRINNISSPAPLFSYLSTPSNFTVLTKSLFLQITSQIFAAQHLDVVFGHSYRIGGTVELLAAGVPPEVVMKLGGWTSLCFLIYWRNLDLLVPSAITRSWAARRDEFARKFHLP